MATEEQVQAGLLDISTEIRTERQALVTSKARIATAEANLNAIPTKYADIIATIDAYTPTGPVETERQDLKARLASTFTALKAKATTATNGLAAIDFTT